MLGMEVVSGVVHELSMVLIEEKGLKGIALRRTGGTDVCSRFRTKSHGTFNGEN